MNMKALEVVTPSPDMYHGLSTSNMLWEEKFTTVNMKMRGRHNVRKHREINNGDQ